jgi:hypothetical protein
MRPGKAWFLVFVIVVCDIVVTWAMIDHQWPDHWTLTQIILFHQAWYFGVMAVSFLAGYLIWRKKSRPLVRNLTRIIDELSSDETSVNGA